MKDPDFIVIDSKFTDVVVTVELASQKARDTLPGAVSFTIIKSALPAWIREKEVAGFNVEGGY